MRDEVTVYGIWMPRGDLGDWFILGDGEVFYTTHRAVAEAQLKYAKRACSTDIYPVIEVRKFPSPTD